MQVQAEIQKRIDATQTIKARTDLPLEFDRENFIEIPVQYCNEFFIFSFRAWHRDVFLIVAQILVFIHLSPFTCNTKEKLMLSFL